MLPSMTPSSGGRKWLQSHPLAARQTEERVWIDAPCDPGERPRGVSSNGSASVRRLLRRMKQLLAPCARVRRARAALKGLPALSFFS